MSLTVRQGILAIVIIILLISNVDQETCITVHITVPPYQPGSTPVGTSFSSWTWPWVFQWACTQSKVRCNWDRAVVSNELISINNYECFIPEMTIQNNYVGWNSYKGRPFHSRINKFYYIFHVANHYFCLGSLHFEPIYYPVLLSRQGLVNTIQLHSTLWTKN